MMVLSCRNTPIRSGFCRFRISSSSQKTVRDTDSSRAHKIGKGFTMSSPINSIGNNSASATVNDVFLYWVGIEQIKLPLTTIAAEKYLTFLKEQIGRCKHFLENTGLTAQQASRSVLGNLYTGSLLLETKSFVVWSDQVLLLTGDFMLPMMLGFAKTSSFNELALPPSDYGFPFAWAYHLLCVDKFGRLLLLSVSSARENTPEIVVVRFLEPSEKFLIALFNGCPELRFVCLQKIGSMVDQQVGKHEKQFASLRETQKVIHTVLNRS